VFFLNAEGKVYGRYGGRDAKNADDRQSLPGLKYTMKSVLKMHASETKVFAPQAQDKPKFLRDNMGGPKGGKGDRCLHCHQVKEVQYSELKKKGEWSRDMAYRYPLPDNVGLILEVDRGNVVKEVQPKTPAAKIDLRPGDVVQLVNGVPVHSMADAQFGLDKAPKKGEVEIEWLRGGEVLKGKLALDDGWKKADVSWRPSLRYLIPSVRLNGTDLTAEERKVMGLEPKQLAFRQKNEVSTQAKAAGILGGDIIVGLDGKSPELDVYNLVWYVQRNYLVGDDVTVNVLRDGKRLDLVMRLRP
jgi:S1-C subfamily serine protease